jgi:hypothetical protein
MNLSLLKDMFDKEVSRTGSGVYGDEMLGNGTIGSNEIKMKEGPPSGVINYSVRNIKLGEPDYGDTCDCTPKNTFSGQPTVFSDDIQR